MKADIHPTYFNDTKISCACGNVMTIGSTRKSISIEVCSNCHPFYTGKKKVIDTQGRVDRFKRMVQKAQTISETKKARAAKKAKPKKTKKTRAKSSTPKRQAGK
jgi:large subunit ribosomal protein L31